MAIFTAIGAWLTATFGAFLAGVIANIAVGAALLGVSALLAGGKAPQSSTPQAQATINQAVGPRIRGYGKAKLGGTRAFWDSSGGTLYQIVMAHHGRIDAIERFFVGDKAVLLDASGYCISSPFYSYLRILPQLGTADQTAHAAMLAAWPGIWTSAHRLRGIANWFVAFNSPPADDYQAIFPEGYNTPVRAQCRLSLVYDPRDPAQDPDDEETWLWSDNASLCILDYLTHKDGYNKTLDDVDIDSFKAFADICAEAIPLAAGGTEPRYRIWGIYRLDEDPQDVLAKMRAACDAEFYQTASGKVAIRGGKWTAPTVTIRERDILGHVMEQGNNRFSAFNELKILYTSADHDFQTMEATAWSDLADQAERGVLQASLMLDMVPSASQARRLAKIHVAKSNPAWKGTVATNIAGLDVLGERTARLVLPELEIDDAFYVAGLSLRPDLTAVETSVLSISEAAYLWTSAEEGQSAPLPEDTSPDLTFPVPTGLVLSEPDPGYVQAEVDDPERDDLDLHLQIRAGAGSLWQEMQVSPGALTGIFGPDASGMYQVRARWRGPLGSGGAWTSPLAEITV